MSKLRVAVIFGGVSTEHDVSLMSACSVIGNIPTDKYEVIMIGITRKGRWLSYPGDPKKILEGKWDQNPDCVPCVISPDRSTHGIIRLFEDGSFQNVKIDVAFPILHGRNGEDGTIQGLLSLSGIPYVGCDTLSSAACMDKAVTKMILSEYGIPNTKWELVKKSEIDNFDEIEQRLVSKIGYPMFVKPANSGSSVGTNRVDDKTSLKDAINIAFAHDRRVLIEQALNMREVECSVLGNDNPIASVVGEISPVSGFYDYDAKYVLGTTKLDIPAELDEAVSEKIREIAVSAYKALGCTGMSRVDFFINKDNGDIILNEINTIPGFTSISMYPKLLEASGISYSELIDRLIEFAIIRAEGQ